MIRKMNFGEVTVIYDNSEKLVTIGDFGSSATLSFDEINEVLNFIGYCFQKDAQGTQKPQVVNGKV